MRRVKSLGSFLAIFVVYTLAAGCSGGESVSISQPRMSSASASRAGEGVLNVPARAIGALRPRFHGASWFDGSQGIRNAVFVADAESNSIEIFDPATKRQTGSIGGLNGPEGLTASVVANDADDVFETDNVSQTIRSYEAPYKRPPSILLDSGYYPSGVYAGTSGSIWVANLCSGVSGACLGPGNTVKYAKGSGNPKALAGGPFHTFFVTENAAGDVWADGQDSAFNGVIGYWKAGKGSFKSVGISLVLPGGLQFDRSGNLLLDDQEGDSNGGSRINVYAPHATNPTRSIVVQTDGDDVVSFALDAKNLRLYAPQFQAGTTAIINYSSGKKVGTLPSTGTPDAVTIVPGEVP